MKFYLSSYKLGNASEAFCRLFAAEAMRIAYVPNALDFRSADAKRRKVHCAEDIASLEALEFSVSLLDLQEYFGKQDALRQQLTQLDGLWVSGGNTFVLRVAMHLSGMDALLFDLKSQSAFVYGGYSAACCVLAPSLEAYQIVDAPEELCYKEHSEPMFQGLGILPFAIMPHYNSNHPESNAIDEEIALCVERKIPFVALSDGEALVYQSWPNSSASNFSVVGVTGS